MKRTIFEGSGYSNQICFPIAGGADRTDRSSSLFLKPFPYCPVTLEHEMVKAMKTAGIDRALIYAFEKTGLLVSEDNQHRISDADSENWNNAIRPYRTKLLEGNST